MSTTESTSSSDSSDISPGVIRHRPSLQSATLPRQSFSSQFRRREQPLRTVSDVSEGPGGHDLTTQRLSRVPSRSSEQTVTEFLRGEARPTLSSSAADLSAEARRQTIMAMDRKRRLTNTTHEGGRRRSTQGGFHERGLGGHSIRMDGPSSSHEQEWPSRSESRDLPRQVIDLTGSSPTGPLAPSFPPSPPRLSAHRQQPPSRASSSSSKRYQVPIWQLDSEVSDCPVCGRTFGWLFRRHHCRKCGRVVCNDCSPHRITIPRSLIVNPPRPNTASLSTNPTPRRIETVDLTGDDDEPNLLDPTARSFRSESDAGVRVRLCNPCVPDPQPTPQEDYALPFPFPSLQRPQAERPSELFSRPPTRTRDSFDPHAATSMPRRRSGVSRENADDIQEDGSGQSLQLPNGSSRYSLASYQGLEPRSMGRHVRAARNSWGNQSNSVTSDLQPVGNLSSSFQDRLSHMRRVLNGGMPPPPTISRPAAPPTHQSHGRYQSIDVPMTSRTPDSRPRIRSMLDVDPNYQRMMEAALGRGAQAIPQPRPRLRESDICPICRHALPPRGADGNETTRESHIIDCISARDPSSIQSSPRRQSMMGQPPPPPAPIHLLSFVATEKDCLGEDGSTQECSICMVEYDVGDQLARLECLCKFHKECIVEWFGRKMECPLHKIA